MPNATMTKWLISQVQLDINALEKGKNELKMNFSFSTLFPENAAADMAGHVKIEFTALTPEEKKFLSVTSSSFYAFSSPDLTEQEKKIVLEEQGFPDSYDKFRSFLSSFTESAQLQKILLPEYSQLK